MTLDIHSLTSDNKYIKDSLITESMEKEEMNMIRSSINLSQKEQVNIYFYRCYGL